MFKYKTKPVEVLDDVICDICKKSCTIDGIIEHATFEADWGYGSHRDGEQWRFHMCEKCAEEVYTDIGDRCSSHSY